MEDLSQNATRRITATPQAIPRKPPPEGFVLMPSDYVAKAGDMGCREKGSWFLMNGWLGRSAAYWTKYTGKPFYIASPIPEDSHTAEDH